MIAFFTSRTRLPYLLALSVAMLAIGAAAFAS